MVKFKALAGVVAISALVAACSGGGSESKEGEKTAAAAPAAPAPAPVAAPAAAPAAAAAPAPADTAALVAQGRRGAGRDRGRHDQHFGSGDGLFRRAGASGDPPGPGDRPNGRQGDRAGHS